MDAKITNSNENKANPVNYSTQGFTGDPNFAGIIAVKMPSKNDIEENTYLNTDKNNKIQQ